MRIIDDPQNGCNSFILGDEISGQATVIDPLEAVGADRYLMEVQDLGMKIVSVIETHIHADHLSAASAIAEELGVPRIMGEGAEVDFKFEGVFDGQIIAMGTVQMKFIHTPGHTPESISIAAIDSLRSKWPQVLFSGDALFAGDVGRPDLAVGEELSVEDATLSLYRSLEKLKGLADYIEVFPSHYGASSCGSIFMSKRQSTTLGYEKLFNRFMQASDYDAFVSLQRGLIGKPPENSKVIRAKNIS